MTARGEDVTARGEDVFVLDFRYMFCDTDSDVYPQTCHVLGVRVTNMYVGWSLTCMWGGHLHACGVQEMTGVRFLYKR